MKKASAQHIIQPTHIHTNTETYSIHFQPNRKQIVYKVKLISHKSIASGINDCYYVLLPFSMIFVKREAHSFSSIFLSSFSFAIFTLCFLFFSVSNLLFIFCHFFLTSFNLISSPYKTCTY